MSFDSELDRQRRSIKNCIISLEDDILDRIGYDEKKIFELVASGDSNNVFMYVSNLLKFFNEDSINRLVYRIFRQLNIHHHNKKGQVMVSEYACKSQSVRYKINRMSDCELDDTINKIEKVWYNFIINWSKNAD